MTLTIKLNDFMLQVNNDILNNPVYVNPRQPRLCESEAAFYALITEGLMSGFSDRKELM